MSVEKAAYQVIIQEGSFELRSYEPMLVVTSRESDLSGGNGFNQLFNYISGNNQELRKISMTAPVIDSLEGQQSTTSFVMPKDFQLKDVPLPNDPALMPREIKARQVAVIRFSGTINSKAISDNRTKLEEWLKKNDMKPIGAMELARYNAPYVPPFARRNELIVEVETAI
jgi:SOUL heme-binding protein